MFQYADQLIFQTVHKGVQVVDESNITQSAIQTVILEGQLYTPQFTKEAVHNE